MRQFTHLVLSISMLAPGLLVAQEEAPRRTNPQAAATSSLPSFVLKMTEFTIPALDEGLAQTLNKGTDWEAAIDDLATQNQLASYEQLHLTLYDGLKARAQFGRRVPIVTGTSSTRFGNVNNITMENVGTLIGVLPRYRQETGDVVLELEYESSRIGPTDDSSTVPDRNADLLVHATLGSRSAGPRDQQSKPFNKVADC